MIKPALITKDNFTPLRASFIYIVFAIFVGAILWLNFLVPYASLDEFLYHHKFDSNKNIFELNLLSSVADYFSSIVEHYKSYNNRIFPHAILQVILQLGKPAFNIINSLVFFLIPIFIIKAGIGAKSFQFLKNHLLLFLSISLFIWSFHFDLGTSYFWSAGSLNYSWMLPLQLYLIYAFANVFDRVYQTEAKWDYKMILASILVCTTNENVVLSLFGLGLALILWKQIKLRKFNISLFLSVAILLLGGMVMYFSPALSARQIDHAVPFESNFAHLKEYTLRQAYYFVKYLPLLIFFPFSRIKKIKLNLFQIGLIGVVLFSNVIMVLAPLCEPRTSIFGFIICLVLIIQILKDQDLITVSFLKYRAIALLIIGITLFISRASKFIEVSKLADQNEKLIQNTQQENVAIPGYYDSRRFSALYVEQFRTFSKHNQLAANFYGKQSLSLTILPYQKLWNKLQNDFDLEDFDKIELKSRFTNEIALNDIYFEVGEGGEIHLLFSINETSKDYRIMFRGSRKNKLAHKLVSYLPYSLQKYFLDYLIFDELPIQKDEFQFHFNHIEDKKKYDYFLIGLYDINKHNQIGEIIILKNSF